MRNTPFTIAIAIAAALALTSPAYAQSQGPDWLLPVGAPSNSQGGGVSSIATACALSGGPITTTGTISGAVPPKDVPTGAAYPFVATDCGALLDFTDSIARAPTLNVALFSQGNYFNIKNDGTATQTITPSAGTINGAATFPVLAGTSYSIAYDAANTNWIVSASYVLGPSLVTPGDLPSFNGASGQLLGDSGISAANLLPPLPATGNGTQIYPLWGPGVIPGAGALAPVQNTARCAPFFVAQPMHWDELLLSVTTLGTGPLPVALYTDAIDATTKKHQPQTPFSSTSLAFTVTGTGNVNVPLGSAGVGISIPIGLNWICTNETTATDAVRIPTVAATSTLFTSLIGVTTLNGADSTSQITAWTISETSGTWPSFVGSAFTESGSVITLMMSYRVASAP